MTLSIKVKRSHATGNTPVVLNDGELAVNSVDKKIWIGNTSNAPVLVYSSATSNSPINSGILNISNSATAVIDATDLATGVIGCEYLLSCKDNINNRLRTTKINFVANTAVVNYDEYSSLASNNNYPVASFTFDVLGSNVRLLANSDSANVTVSFIKSLTGNNISNGHIAGFVGSTTPMMYVQDTRPTALGPWQWWKTEGGIIIDLIVNDGGP